MEPVSFGLCGLGGYAGHILKYLLRDGALPQPPVKLIAACEPAQELHADRIAEAQSRGIKVSARFEDLLAEPIEAVWLPLPIHLHRPFTEQALAAGKAVMCEKPVTGSIDDLDALIAARDRAKLPVTVGFQDIYEPSTNQMKQILLDGTIGKIRFVTVRGEWARDSSYYSRNKWAGRLRVGDTWVLDSPANNAMAHFLMLALFLLGKSRQEADLPVSVEAELYRANTIENYDTCALRIQTSGGTSVLVLDTHACQRHDQPELVLHGERGTLTYRAETSAEVRTSDGKTFTVPVSNLERTSAMIHLFARLVRGLDDQQRNVATLEVARSHTLAINGASEASPVYTIPEDQIDIIPREKGSLREVRGIHELFDACIAQQRMPHETGLVKWTRPAGQRDLRGYNHFAGPAV